MEKNLLDTSRLIDAYRRGEKIEGYTTILNLIEFPKAVEMKLRVLYPSRSDYDLALKISAKLSERGKGVPAVDLIMAAVAINNGLRILTRDRHFLFIKEAVEEVEVSIE